MSKEILSINDFSTWIINDDTVTTNKGFADVSWLDIYTEEWVAQPNVKPLAETTPWIDLINGYVDFDGRVVWWWDNEEIWYNNTWTTWTLLNTNTNAWDNDDLVVYQNYLIYASDSKLWRSTTTTIAWGFTDNPTWGSGSDFLNWTSTDIHIFKIFNNRLYVTDWNVLAELDWASDPTTPTNWVFTQDKFKLPEWEIIQSLEIVWGQLALWTADGNLYIWDGSSSNSSAIIPTKWWGITAMIQLENTLFVYAWVDWTIYRYNGADLVPVIQIPDVITSSSWTFVQHNWVKRYRNGIIFGLSLNWLYVFNRVKEWDSFSLVKYWNLSVWQSIKDDQIDVSALHVIPWKVVSWDTIFISYNDSINAIDRVTNTNGLYDDAFLETVDYELRNNNWQATKVQGVQLKFKQLISWTITVKYKTDYNNTFTTLWTIDHVWFTSNSKELILRWIWLRVDKIIFRFEWLNWKLINIKIF